MIKYLLKFVCFLSLIMPFSLDAFIIESNKIDSVLNYADQNSLVLFNISNTLYEPLVTMADKRWRTFFGERAEQALGNSELAQKLSDRVEGIIVAKIPKKLVEENTPLIIKRLQEQKISTFGITQKRLSTPYAPNFGEITSQHLIDLGINLQKSLAYTKVNPTESANFVFTYGIIFTQKKTEGMGLRDFLAALNETPKKVIVIENSAQNLKEIEETLSHQNIDFIGIRYGRADSKKAEFDPILGVIQFLAFVSSGETKVLSDQEALAIKMQHPHADRLEELDSWIKSNANYPGL